MISPLFQQPVCEVIHPQEGTWYGLLWDIIIESRCLAWRQSSLIRRPDNSTVKRISSAPAEPLAKFRLHILCLHQSAVKPLVQAPPLALFTSPPRHTVHQSHAPPHQHQSAIFGSLQLNNPASRVNVRSCFPSICTTKTEIELTLKQVILKGKVTVASTPLGLMTLPFACRALSSDEHFGITFDARLPDEEGPCAVQTL